MADILGSLLQGWQGGAQMRQQQDRRTLADLLGKARGASGAERDGFMQQSYSLDPNTAMQAEQSFGQLDDAKRQRLGQTAAVFSRMPPEMRAQLWPQVREQVASILPGEYPEQWDESLLPVAEGLAQQFGGASAAEQYTLTPGSARYDASGNLIAERPQAPPKPDYIFQTDADGNGFWLQKPNGGPQSAPAPTTGGGARVMDSAYQGGMGFDPLRDAVEFHESRGNPDAVSPAGAVGRMQTMPGTLLDPGFGVQPARDQSDAERTRVGNEYLQAMLQKYGSPELALAAYNWGPGNVDQALQRSGGDPRAVLASAPQETQAYVQNVMASAGGQGGPTAAQAAPGGAIPVPGFRGKSNRPAAPSGFRWAADGQSLEPIPGGPADPSAKPPAARKPMSGDVANKVGLYDNAIRSAREWFDMVAEKDASGNFTGRYNNAAAMGPAAQSAFLNALRAKLRAESGAAISESEIDGEAKRYAARMLGGDHVDVQNAARLLRDLVQQREMLVGARSEAEGGGQYQVGQVIEKGGRKYRVVGGDMDDPDVEEI